VIGSALHLPGFTHDHSHTQLAGDASLRSNEVGIRTIWLALLVLGTTTILQVIIYLASGSVALLADTVHNLGDALNSIPLLIAFYLSRRLANRRYTYGYGRAEDVAGVLIVASIAFSAAYILYEAVDKLINPQPLTNLGWVAAAAVIGFIGNELVAIMQIRVGRRINSDAMVADGQHARIDGLTSLAVLIGAFGGWIGVPILDPIIGIVIGVAIVGITWSAIKAIWYRLMDAVDPQMVQAAESTMREHAEVTDVSRLQLRWVGHRLHGEIALTTAASMMFPEVAALREHLHHHLEYVLPNLEHVTIQISPQP
jgi:cation diffusion facilitator family transporter